MSGQQESPKPNNNETARRNEISLKAQSLVESIQQKGIPLGDPVLILPLDETKGGSQVLYKANFPAFLTIWGDGKAVGQDNSGFAVTFQKQDGNWTYYSSMIDTDKSRQPTGLVLRWGPNELFTPVSSGSMTQDQQLKVLNDAIEASLSTEREVDEELTALCNGIYELSEKEVTKFQPTQFEGQKALSSPNTVIVAADHTPGFMYDAEVRIHAASGNKLEDRVVMKRDQRGGWIVFETQHVLIDTPPDGFDISENGRTLERGEVISALQKAHKDATQSSFTIPSSN